LLAGLPAGRAFAQTQGLPLKHTPQPTTAAITPADLETRLYIFADDSMHGRQFGREGNFQGTNYIARQAELLGLQPAGDKGTWFQELPAVVRKFSDRSQMSMNGRPLRWLTDFVAVPARSTPQLFETAQVIYGGVAGDTANEISEEQAAGKLVVLKPAERGPGAGGFRGRGGYGGFGRTQRFASAAAIATVDLQTLDQPARALLNNPAGSMTRAGAQTPPPSPVTLRITPEAAAQLFGRPLDALTPGATGGTVQARLDYVEQPVGQFARNVVGIIPGSDPKLAGEYVALGAHNDHNGFNAAPVDHDSARAYATAEYLMRIVGTELQNVTPEQVAGIHINLDSIRALRPAREDSIYNGADDDGSGSMALLEIAEAIAKAPVKPRRSILFVWHTGEEAGLLGSSWYVSHPTVPLDSVVTELNIDMIGRGDAGDIPGGGPNYLAVVGSSMLSSDLGKAVADVNARQPQPLKLDYQFDEPSTWPGYNNLYNRSDHVNYARANIPIAFFFTGLHQDYHRVTDEPQYIDYPHYARIVNYIHDLAVDIANRDQRPVVDKPTT